MGCPSGLCCHAASPNQIHVEVHGAGVRHPSGHPLDEHHHGDLRPRAAGVRVERVHTRQQRELLQRSVGDEGGPHLVVWSVPKGAHPKDRVATNQRRPLWIDQVHHRLYLVGRPLHDDLHGHGVVRDEN